MKVSIITVCLNSEKYISETISSVLGQVYSDIEYIVIDGESSDSTIDIIRSYDDCRLQLITGKDESMYDAINKGIAICTGDIIAILNSDDLIFDKTAIGQIVDEFKFEGTNGVYSNVQIINAAGQVMFEKKSFPVTLRSYFAFGNGALIPHTSLYLKREVFNQIGLYDLSFRYASDYDFILRCLQNFDLKHIDKPLFAFRRHSESITASGKIRLERQSIRRGMDISISFFEYSVVRIRFILRNIDRKRMKTYFLRLFR